MDREAAVSQSLIAQEQTLSQAGQETAAVEEELKKAREERDGLSNVISGYEMRLAARKKKAADAEHKHVELKMQGNNLTSRIHMLSEMEKVYEGYSKAVKLVMGEAERGSLYGIHGPVASLLHVPDRYAVAIETALGGAMQHLVVDGEEDGKAAIQYLKRRDAGRATFLPLSTIRPAEFRDAGAVREPGVVGLGNTLIEFDRRYERIFSNLLGRVVIAEDLDAAIAIARKYHHRFKAGHPGRPGAQPRRVHDRRLGQPQRGASSPGPMSSPACGSSWVPWRDDLKGAARALEEAKREATAAAYELEAAQEQRRAPRGHGAPAGGAAGQRPQEAGGL